MLRVPLHELCLQIKLLDLGEIEPFLAKALEPPAAHAVREAITTLAELQALEGPQQELTPLGHHLATLPVDVRIGKMLLFGRFVCVAAHVLACAACMSTTQHVHEPCPRRA